MGHEEFKPTPKDIIRRGLQKAWVSDGGEVEKGDEETADTQPVVDVRPNLRIARGLKAWQSQDTGPDSAFVDGIVARIEDSGGENGDQDANL